MKKSNSPFFISNAAFLGASIFGALCILIFIAPDLIRYSKAEKPIQFEELSMEEKKAFIKIDKNSKYAVSKFKKKGKFRKPPRAFDPNLYTLEQWKYLGLSEKQAKVVLKFTKFGIKSNDKLQKIFVINDELFQLIKDSTFYSKSSSYSNKFPTNFEKTSFQTKEKAPVLIDINSASADDLMKVPGVGDFFAKQIIKKRVQLGGFYSIDQLAEVWKVDAEKIAAWKPFFRIYTNDIQKININTASAEELKSHPYFSWNLANSLVKLRIQKGGFSKIEDIKKSVLMNDELYNKLKYYLKTEE